ncbi:glycerophosphodiester phosphodiesterase [Lysinibacillus yapensis]|uniref:Glycerophosphodiester phosphodiesterase n=1 Tax=Ureibacillus yapensis TaxID=2304605 RepID=A0A396SAR0_9BACL|nr:glycerophosphodiester phosphodiesterase family protein [Lysinibacillus yapensis]RHW38438.1 glycerophosphodiester phosphodiesterase [Lysinibacillus yapensis]
MSKSISIFAHRGASGHALENTFKSFEKARILKADGIELDIQCTKDGVLIVFHDFELFRLTGINKKISECTYEELMNFPLGKHFFRKFSKERIPSFQQVVEWANFHNMPLNVELKETLLNNREAMIEGLKKLKLPAGSHFSSFHDELLRLVKMQRPDYETAFIVTKKFDWQELVNLSHIDAVHAHKKYYKQRYLEAAQQAGKGIRFYAVNGTEPYLAAPDESVVGWITDYPDKVAKKVKGKKTKQAFS